MTTWRKRLLATAAAAGIGIGALVAPQPAMADVLPTNVPCPQTISFWLFIAGRHNEYGNNLSINYQTTTLCGYIAETYHYSGQHEAPTSENNKPVAIRRGFNYPVLI